MELIVYIIRLVSVDHFGVFNVDCIFSSFLIYIQKLPATVRKPVSIFPKPQIFYTKTISTLLLIHKISFSLSIPVVSTVLP